MSENVIRFLPPYIVKQEDIDKAMPGCRHLQPGEEEMLTLIQNRAFAGQWGYNPNTVEMITHDINRSNRSHEDVILTCEDEKVIGYCWTSIIDNTASGGERRGLINMIGTDPDFRGKGLGKKVLFAGLAHLKSKGLKYADLAVDSQNKVAYELYRSIVFELQGSNLWYEKTLD